MLAPTLALAQNLTLSNTTFVAGPAQTVRASNTITTQGTVTVAAGADVVFEVSSARITLQPGFRAEQGGRFRAAIVPGVTSQTLVLTSGSTAVAAGGTGTSTIPLDAVTIFSVSGGDAGGYVWRVDGVTQSATGGSLSSSFSSSGSHVVRVAPASDPTQVATINVNVTSEFLWTVATGANHALALKSDGTVWTWGANGHGQLGDGTTIARDAPAPVATLSGVIAIAAGGNCSLAVRNDGSVWSWGANDRGQLGDSTAVDRTVPVQVLGLSGIVQLAVSGGHTLALKNDGTVWSWGANESGQLGDGTTAQRRGPVWVSVLTGVTTLAAGGNHSVAVASNGAVWAWGENDFGQLGDGTTTPRLIPYQIAAPADAIEVAAGTKHTVVLAADGSVWACGANSVGQLGEGTINPASVLAQIGGLGGVHAIQAGNEHSIAVRWNGTVWAWGRNDLGQLGDGTTTNRSTPVLTGGVAGIVVVSAAGNHSLAVKADGSIWAWGGDGFGDVAFINRRTNQIALRLKSSLDDTDQDGMADALEVQFFGDLSHSGSEDSDSDGLSDVQELFVGSNPASADADGDGVTDRNDQFPNDYYNNEPVTVAVLSGNEQLGAAGQFNREPFDIVVAATTGVQLLSNVPIHFSVVEGGGLLATSNTGTPALTSSLDLTTDADGTVQAYYKHPASGGILSRIKVAAGTTQLFLATLSGSQADTDHNGLLDDWEMANFGHLGVSLTDDWDSDGLSNFAEMSLGTDPKKWDTDRDGMRDGDESTVGRDPLNWLDGASMPEGKDYRVILRTPEEYLGVKSDWSLEPTIPPPQPPAPAAP